MQASGCGLESWLRSCGFSSAVSPRTRVGELLANAPDMASRSALLHCFASVCLIFGVSQASTAHDLAPAGDYEGKPIVEVRFHPPSQPVARADLARMVPLKPAMTLHG